ncbi:DUF4157 domain-containing protein [Undibacterium sp. Ji49W]|uniref:eCIS core domain-containing protein n=1 Tax=Undibacterium sp. Ji49W TaxID=3413040 RepID=UPI003BEF679D
MKTQQAAPAEAQTAQQAIRVESQSAQLSTEPQAAFTDNRPAAVAQRQLQTLVNNSPQTMQASTLQAMMNNSPQAQHMRAIQRMADQSAQGHRLATATDNAPLQRMAEAAPVQREVQAAAPKPNDTGLPDNLKSGIEGLSGHSLDDVKVHYNSPQPAQLQAHAYAQGTDIHLAPGQEQHLPHEAWHVVQQKQGRVRPTFQMKAGVQVNDDVGLESEADMMGSKALSLGTAQLARDSQTTHGRERGGSRDPVQRKLMPHVGGSGVVQAVTDGKTVSLPLLGVLAEDETGLKQWAKGNFYAWDLSLQSKDERHAHAFNFEKKDSEVSFDGHVVTAKGPKADAMADAKADAKEKSKIDKANEAKRNQTSHRFEGVKGAGDIWQAQAHVRERRLDLPHGRNNDGGVIRQDGHDAYATSIRDNLLVAFTEMLNLPDALLKKGNDVADELQKGFKDEKDAKETAKEKDVAAATEQDSDEVFGLGGLSDMQDSVISDLP